MRVLVTGVAGQLGHDVMEELNRRGYEAIGTDLHTALSLDLTDKTAVAATVAKLAPDAVIHCAAWTAVDAAEDPANESAVYAINADATKYLAQAVTDVNAKMVYLSTDYVFSGSGTTPRVPDETDFDPLNVYGRSKLAGEEAVRSICEKHFIVRIAWVFGINGNNFVKAMLRAGATHDSVRVVDDQIGTPTYTTDLARLLVDMIETEQYGTYHATNEGGYISWYDFACEIFSQAGYHTKVIPVTTKEYGLSRAARPFNSRLDKAKLREAGYQPLPDWKDALRRYLEQMGLERN